ncbi:slit homolog 1 protein-like isoform X2 [Cimex lectularius]|uniref:Uncharacterized protein n=1 Tax=Cimex lectularius TaxID=79782 RepID=A0A8I6SRN7_CIMLE|nr:slit homolog 1 protein-like isoform X2 [Cimex lectularius]
MVIITKGRGLVSCVGKTIVSVDLDIPKNVQWLQLSHNSIYEIRDFQFWDLQLVYIVELDLAYNQIQQIGLNAFDGMRRLKKLDLSYNHLYHIMPNTFEANKQLEMLILQGNPLRYITQAESFLVSNSINYLDLSNCRVSHFHPLAFKSLPNLKHLNISHTWVSQIRTKVLDTLVLQLLDITETGIKCDGDTRALINWASNYTKIIGSPCKKNLKAETKKFEKLIAIKYPYFSEEDNEENRSSEEEYKCEPKDQTQAITTTRKPEETTKKKNFSLGYREHMLALSFFCGLIIGGAFSTTVIFMCIYSWKAIKTRRRRRMRQFRNNIYTTCETPPPTYCDLFGTN